MQLRPFNRELDYPVIANWYEAHEQTPVPLECLPQTGFIVEDQAAMFMFSTDSSVSIIEFLISNPAADKTEKCKAISLLIDTLLNEARARNVKHVLAFAKLEKIKKSFASKGFHETETGLSTMAGKF